MKSFKSIGISYKTASLELREQVTFTEDSAKAFMRRAQEVLGLNEMLVLSTCNRTEIYYTSDERLKLQLCTLMDIHHGLKEPSANHFDDMEGEEAIRHLYEVALGVDSMVLGDMQITNQVKSAYQWSADENMAGPFLHRLLHSIFYTNKRVVQETELRDGTASTASVSADLIKNYIGAFSSPTILILGLGEIGQTVAENLKGVEAEVRVLNRTRSKAEALATQLGYVVGEFDNLQQEINKANVVVSAIHAEHPIITSETLAEHHLPKLMIDLSVPRSIDDSVESQGVVLYNVDQLEQRACKALERRQKALPSVITIIEESLGELQNWAQEMEVSPTIKKLKNALEEIRKEEMSRYLSGLSDKEVEVLDKATKGIIQKVMKLPVLQLKAACKRGEAETLVEVLNDLFNLEKESSGKTAR
ncbi:glutamyl-tRNA reductase [Marinoscillum sp. MHG1-6]|uniref:glutamyl-tRNA reductase n=1 Tax=Marinoscillum sp. MHG1-6 TaxID=2959627 RepID=UPI0021573CEA|nr:glutamyl-tRNA reductase [Marinoscillum sp. MHG1-6]